MTLQQTASEGLSILRRMNEYVTAAPKSLTEEPPERVLKEKRCKVYNCRRPAVWRCSGGFRYCDSHLHELHDWPADHLFVLMAQLGEPKVTFER